MGALTKNRLKLFTKCKDNSKKEAVASRRSSKYVLLKILQNSQENICARASGLQLY